MDIDKKISLDGGFGGNRKRVQAKFFSSRGNNWQNVDILIGSDEGTPLIALSTEIDVTSTEEPANPVKVVFRVEDLPSLIATLIDVGEESKKTMFQNLIKWEGSALERKT